MPREAEPSINERAFVLEALRNNIRLDGRALDTYRPFQISFGDDYGAADVRLGKTRSMKSLINIPTCRSYSYSLPRVLARVSASVTAPYPDRKFDGIFTISAEVSPLASPAFEVGR